MGSESKNRNVDGCGGGGGEAAAQGVPEMAKKLVRNVKEIVNCTEQEIYAVLKECDMDPNRAVERLLAQGFTLSLLCLVAEKIGEDEKVVDYVLFFCFLFYSGFVDFDFILRFLENLKYSDF